MKKTFKFNKEDFIITFVGRIAAEKNVMFLVKAHKKLLKKIKNAKLVIIGDGPDLDKYRKYVLAILEVSA